MAAAYPQSRAGAAAGPVAGNLNARPVGRENAPGHHLPVGKLSSGFRHGGWAMKWRTSRQSSNIEDRRGQGMGAMGMGGLGLGGIALVVVVSLLFGQNPLEVLGSVAQQQPATSQTGEPPPPTEATQFVAHILGSTEETWGAIFTQAGQQYPPPRLVLFSGMVASACGRASSATGPFYCPGDQQVYIDTAFFDEMQAKLGGGGDFAQAYVIAHEVGHHIQTITGVSDKVNQMRARGANVEGDNGLLVRQELQADCYAGVWGNLAQQQYQWLESGDIEEALTTAAAIGDDRLQRQSQGMVVPDSFTHGTSAQRVRWFRTGYETGDVNRCDTFSARSL
jgi:predicted metalloprotease